MVTQFVLTGIALVIAGLAKGFQDSINFHYGSSIARNWNPNFWNPAISWRNKYKNGDPAQGRKFIGSITWAVSITDGWHMMDLIRETAFESIGAVWIVYTMKLDWYYIILALAAIKTINSIGFHITYQWFVYLRKKTT